MIDDSMNFFRYSNDQYEVHVMLHYRSDGVVDDVLLLSIADAKTHKLLSGDQCASANVTDLLQRARGDWVGKLAPSVEAAMRAPPIVRRPLHAVLIDAVTRHREECEEASITLMPDGSWHMEFTVRGGRT